MKKLSDHRNRRADAAKYALSWVKEYIWDQATPETEEDIWLIVGGKGKTGALKLQLIDMVFGYRRDGQDWPRNDARNFLEAWDITSEGIILPTSNLGRQLYITGVDVVELRRRLFYGLWKSDLIAARHEERGQWMFAEPIKQKLIADFRKECEVFVKEATESGREEKSAEPIGIIKRFDYPSHPFSGG